MAKLSGFTRVIRASALTSRKQQISIVVTRSIASFRLAPNGHIFEAIAHVSCSHKRAQHMHAENTTMMVSAATVSVQI
jgi:hypothetical protein